MDNAQHNGTQYVHPAIRELRNRLHECRQELLALMTDWYYLQNILHPQIMFQYDTYFGDLEYELQKRSRIASELERRVDLLSLKLKKGERITENTIKFVNNVIKKEFERTERQTTGEYKAENYNLFQDTIEKNSWLPQCEVNVKYELPQLYRRIVKKLHPDIVGESENFLKYWDNVQDAYRSRNLNRIRLFHQTLCPDDRKKFPDLRQEEISLRTEIRQLEININRERMKINKIKQDEPFTISEKLNDTLWITRRQRWLKEKLFRIDLKIHHNKRVLLSLTAGARQHVNRMQAV